MVIGYLKPVILLPVGLATSLPIDQVEAILAHEMAHIRRNDYLINLLKSLMEVIFFYHPAIWWISSMLEIEREHCCDDTAIRICGNEKSLQSALLNLQQYEQNTIALAPALINNNYKLLNRIIRMKTTHQFKHGMKGSLAGFLVLLGGMIILATSSAFSPRLSDLPGEYKTEKIGLTPANLLAGTQDVLESTGDHLNASEPNDFKEVISGSIPDTTIKNSGTSSLNVSDKVIMEFDGNYNLISVKKDGKPLEGNDKKEYEAMAAKMKKLNEQEQQQVEQKAALEIAEKELQAAQEKIEKAQQEYEKAVEAYAKSYTFEVDSSETNVFVWTDRSGKSPKAVREIRIERHPDFPEIPEMYAFSLTDEDLPETYEELISAKEFEIQLNKLENDLKIIEIEKDIDEIQAPKKIIVKTSGSEDLVPTLRKELVKDGLLKNEDEGMSFSLSEDELEVNGKKLSEDMHKKYLKLYKQTTGNKLEGKFKIVIKD
jgi:tetratricopeptide (TPR) repeat protein